MTTLKTIHCRSWDQFTTAIDGTMSGQRSLFRGHADASWPLTPPGKRNEPRQWERPTSAGIHLDVTLHQDLDERFLEKFKMHARNVAGFVPDPKWTDAEWWALGRHHGLHTPYLDWTENPWVAAFFAFSESADKRLADRGISAVAVWCFDVSDLRGLSELDVVWAQTDRNARQRAQQGAFTRITGGAPVDLETYLAARDRVGLLTKIVLPANAADEALLLLEKRNLTYATLFPDLDGAAKQAMHDRELRALTNELLQLRGQSP